MGVQIFLPLSIKKPLKKRGLMLITVAPLTIRASGNQSVFTIV
jgi:hypothetical protein